MMRAAASSGRVERDYQIVSSIIDDREIAEIWQKGATWQAFRGAYEPAFQSFMDSQFAIADRAETVQPAVG
jgi:hypothetical protein